jgi:LCP family protein required for cell wall assembly
MAFSKKIIVFSVALFTLLLISVFVLFCLRNPVHSADTPAINNDDDTAVQAGNDSEEEKHEGGNEAFGFSNSAPDEEEDLDSIIGLTEGEAYSRELVEEGSTNILIVGEDKENYLFDTIGIISVNKSSRKVKIIMIPRDTYIQYNRKVLKALRDAGKLGVPGVFKINYAHHIGPFMKYGGKFGAVTSMSFLADVIKEKFGVEVNDYVKVNVEGFVEIVDLFGGVEIDVPYLMNYYDPAQELTIYLEKGLQTLDGKQAEGFVRFRQGFDENGEWRDNYGDTERKKNQIAFIKAFIKQHGTIENIDKIPQLVKTLQKNVKHSIGVGDVLFKYIGLAKDVVLKEYEIESINLWGPLKWIDGVQYMVLGEE